MLIYVNTTNEHTDRQTYQNYSSEAHKTGSDFFIEKNITLLLTRNLKWKKLYSLFMEYQTKK